MQPVNSATTGARVPQPSYVQVLNELLHPEKCPDQKRFFELTHQLETYILSAGFCGSDIAVDPFEDTERAVWTSGLWKYREDNNIQGMLNSQYFKHWTTRKLKSEETPVKEDFYQRFGTLIIEPALKKDDAQHFLGHSWTSQLLELRAKVLCMMGSLESRARQLDEAEKFGPLYPNVVTTLFRELWSKDLPCLSGLSKEEKVALLEQAKQLLEQWPEINESVSEEATNVMKFVSRRTDLLESLSSRVHQAVEEDEAVASWVKSQSGGNLDAFLTKMRGWVHENMVLAFDNLVNAVKHDRL